MRFLVLFLIIFSFVSSAVASTFTVERDGSGDFTVIQDAVDAAASGDTIRIGPGRYDEKQIVTTAGWTEYVRVLITQDVLTIIGSGDSTIIGPESPWVEGRDRGLVGSPYFDSNDITIASIRFENMSVGIHSDPAADLAITSCSFSGLKYPVFVGGGGELVVDGCLFENLLFDGVAIISFGSDDFRVSDCSFNFSASYAPVTTGIIIQGVPFALVQGCEFIGAMTGVKCNYSSSATLNNCVFSGQLSYGIYSNGMGSLRVSDCQLLEQRIALGVKNSNVIVSSTMISEVTEASFGLHIDLHLSVNNCILAHGPEYTVRQYRLCDKAENDLIQLDFTNNDWGTTDADEIESLIHVCDFEVDYVPYWGMPVDTEETSLGSLKAMYR